MEALLAMARRIRKGVGGKRAWDAIRPLYWKTVAAAAGPRGVSLALPDGHSYRMDPRFYAWQLDRYEPDVIRELKRTLTDTSIVYDIGAHVGIMTMMTARVVSRGRIYAFEPSPPNCNLLERHIRINGFSERVTIARTLLGDRLHDAVPFVHRDEHFTANSLAYPIDRGHATPTRMSTIDQMVSWGDTLPPTHIKIDVEGYEGAVLRGAGYTLRTFRPLVICAMHPEPLALLGENTEAIVRFLASCGYDALTLGGEPVNCPGFEEIVFRPTAQG